MAYPTAPPSNIIIGLDDNTRLEKFKNIASRYEIKYEYCQKLRQLEGFEIVFLCDDSGSMTQIIDDDGDPFSKKKTRWDELKHTVSIIMELATVLDKDGIDLYFLNRPPVYNVFSIEQVHSVFQFLPNGYTPLTQAIDRIFKEKESVIKEGKLLLIIATDGEPTDHMGNSTIEQFIKRLTNRPKNVFVSIMACTDNDESMKYLNNLDKITDGIDVNDDYRSELKEIQEAQGMDYRFSYGDYVVKSLLGSIDPTIGNQDQQGKKILPSTTTHNHCCTIA